MSTEEIVEVLQELNAVLGEVDVGSLRALEEKIGVAQRVYVAGAGRSGLMVRAFAMRLMHLGLKAFVVGDATTPAFRSGDLLVVGCGSGETGSLCVVARRAKSLGGVLALVTIVPNSTLGQLADVVIRLDAPSPKAEQQQERSQRTSAQPMGSLFEQALLLLLDVVVMRIAKARKALAQEMFGRHANLE